MKICLDENIKGSQFKKNNTTGGNNSEGNCERRKTKKIPRQDKTKQTKRDISKRRKKILLASRDIIHEDIPTTRCKGSKTSLELNMGTKRT